MLQSFFTTALRQLAKNKTYATLNILGLSIGLACFAIISLWVKDEVSYDRFNTKHQRIYRVAANFTDESGKFDQAVTCIPLAPALAQDLPEVEQAVTIDVNDAVVKYEDKQFVEDEILGVSEGFLDVFNFKLIRGNSKNALTDPYSVVLSESMTKKYFGSADPIGSSIRMFIYDPDGNGAEYKVTGVIEDTPLNSHFSYNFLFSISTVRSVSPNSFTAEGWFNNGYYTYALLKEGASADQLESKLPAIAEKYMGKEMKQYNIHYDYFLQPLTDIHLNSHLRYEIKPTNSVAQVAVFGTIGFIVLLLACINYVNLSTAYASDRFKEVGVRKVLGALKKQLVTQYLVESWLLSVMALLVAFVWIELSRPVFEALTGKPMLGLYSTETLVLLSAIASFSGLLSGLYPSFMLSAFKTVNVLKGQFKSGSSGILLRKTLVVIQFSITVVLIVGILVVQRQLNFIQNRDLGFDKENLLMLNGNGSNEIVRGFDAFAEQVKSNSFVQGLSRSNSMLANGLGNSVGTAEDASGKKVNATVYRLRIDHDYLDTYMMKLIAGRNLIVGSASDSSGGFIVNEALTKHFGYKNPADAIGKYFQFQGREGSIVGVVKDFHYNSLEQKIEPTCMFLLNRNFSRISIRITGDPIAAKEKISSLFKKHFPNTVLDTYYADDRVEKQYQSEKRFSNIFLIFSTVSLAMACLGLFSLVSYSVESRTKEIGIRKVLGASVSAIFRLITIEYLTLILISCVIAIPFGYYFMKNWLQGFAYHTSLEVHTFIYAGFTTLFIALLTVSIKSIRSALANPVRSLRNE